MGGGNFKFTNSVLSNNKILMSWGWNRITYLMQMYVLDSVLFDSI